MQLIVVGMHRSGTSMLARILNLMGAYFGGEGVSTGANQENPKGFWERRDVRNINDAVLHSLGCDWNRVSKFDVGSLARPVLEKFRIDASRVILELDAHRPWLMKEPRLCLLLSLWKPLLETPVCIHIMRHPVEVAASLRTRNSIPIEAGLALWQRYNYDAMLAMQGLPRVCVSYEEIIRDPVHMAAEIHGSLTRYGVTPSRLPSASEILAFVDRDLHRERHEAPDLAVYADAPQCGMYKRLIQSRNPSQHELALSSDVVAALRTYEATLPDFSPPKSKVRTDREALDEANQALKLHEVELSAAKRELQLRCEFTEQLKQDADGSRRAASIAIDECQRLRAQLDEIYGARKTDQLHLEQLRSQMTQCEMDRAVGLERLKQVQALLAQSDAAREVLVARVASLEEEIAAERQGRALAEEAASEAIAKAMAQQSAADSALADRFRETATLTSLLNESEQAMARLQSVAAGLRHDLARSTQEKLDLAASLEGASAHLEALQSKISVVSDFLRREKVGALALVNSLSWRSTAPLRKAWGILRGRRDPERPVYGADVLQLYMSDLFEPRWYLDRYRDVGEAGLDPVVHYLAYGADEGRDPGPRFSTNGYLENNPDVRTAGMNPLLHFLTYGLEEGRMDLMSSSEGASHG